MIFDQAKNLDFYKNLGIDGRYAKAVEFLKTQDLAALENGKYEIDGKAVFANVMSYTTLPWEEAKYEAHENYTDIQYIISGSEVMTYAPVESLQEKVPYNPEKDVVFFDNQNPGLQVVAGAGEFMIFQPWDGHKPKACNQTPSEVKKVVVKILEK
ncbi:MAG: YhcH/YjgK/YiaL family protein [Lachnospiraceae bacterium]